jgi:hypothetical protein
VFIYLKKSVETSSHILDHRALNIFAAHLIDFYLRISQNKIVTLKSANGLCVIQIENISTLFDRRIKGGK